MWRIISFALIVFVSALLIVSAVRAILSIAIPLLVIVAVVFGAFMAWRSYRRKDWW